MRIQQLSPMVTNQIAAGEVIERPASVIKELLENALDAGANTISIEIDSGGLNQMKVSDNGRGIVADDLHLAIAAHATSKIRQLDDLYQITSLGFRGEALASIASISRLSLRSKPETQDHAMMLRAEGSSISLSPCARSQGTTVEVRDLFFNAPVRKKFLKTERIEYQAIEAVIKRFALSEPEIALTLKHNDKPYLALPAAHCEVSKLQRIRKLLGKKFVEQAIYFEVEQAGMRLQAWVSGHTYQRSQNDKQWVYINQRMVKDRLINHAIKQAYAGLLHPGCHPACLLYLTISPQDVDVNVHPTKHEVRFQNPRLVHDFVTSQMVQALACPQLIPAPVHFPPAKPTAPMEIREAYIKPSLLAGKHAKDTVASPWFVLNCNFALLFLHDDPYLVDVERVQAHRLTSLLNQQQLPLASRPLLVPISYKINKADSHLIERCQPMLAQLGIQLDFVSDCHVTVRTIPLLLPTLDIQQLLHRLNGINPDQSALLNVLIDCQSFHAQQVDEDEKSALVAYLHQALPTSNALKTCCLHLNLEACRGILHA